MGFCIFNNIAVGAAHAITVHGLERVAIVDFDVHHGNGTEDIFSGDNRVLMCSTFQHPFYPGTGAGDTAPNIVNCPLPAMTDGADFRATLRAHWLPVLEAFEPQLILVSAGFDGHIEDDMAQMRLREPDYEWVTLEICDLAEAYDAMVMVDDSHATGFVGKTGRGTHEKFGVMDRVDIITGTLGKALGGASGGYTTWPRRARNGWKLPMSILRRWSASATC